MEAVLPEHEEEIRYVILVSESIKVRPAPDNMEAQVVLVLFFFAIFVFAGFLQDIACFFCSR